MPDLMDRLGLADPDALDQLADELAAEDAPLTATLVRVLGQAGADMAEPLDTNILSEVYDLRRSHLLALMALIVVVLDQLGEIVATVDRDHRAGDLSDITQQLSQAHERLAIHTDDLATPRR